MTILVVSTGLASPNREKCMASVAGQRGVEFEHIYIEASERPERLKVQNWYESISAHRGGRPIATDVVCLLDGDDHLPHFDVLARVQREHDAGAWVTYGSYEQADGRSGCCASVDDDDVRTTHWRLSHLKTFRMGLFQRIDVGHLKRDGRWLAHATDLAVMFPVWEQCPPERRRFISDITYVYDLAASFEWSATPYDLQHEAEDVAYVRGLPRYERVAAL